MNHSEFFKLIRKELPCGALILHGEEEYVKAQAVKLAVGRIEEDFRPFNVMTLTKPNPQELSEACETLPLFTDRRIVIVYDLPEGADTPKYIECFKAVPEETLLLVVFKGKLSANSSVLKYANAENRIVLFDPLTDVECLRWCTKRFTQRGVSADEEAVRLLVRLAGTDMANLVSETDKLADLAGEGGRLTAQDVSACIKPELDVRIFDMLNMFVKGKPGDGIVALHALMDEGNEPMSISSFLSSRFKLMLEARGGIDSGKSRFDVLSKMDGNRYAAERAYEDSRYFRQEELLELINELSDTAYMKISGTVKDEKYLELVLLKHEWRQYPVK